MQNSTKRLSKVPSWFSTKKKKIYSSQLFIKESERLICLLQSSFSLIHWHQTYNSKSNHPNQMNVIYISLSQHIQKLQKNNNNNNKSKASRYNLSVGSFDFVPLSSLTLYLPLSTPHFSPNKSTISELPKLNSSIPICLKPLQITLNLLNFCWILKRKKIPPFLSFETSPNHYQFIEFSWLFFFKNPQMGMNTITMGSVTQSHYHTHKVFLFCNYILLGAASSCIFLTLSLRLFPSICGFFLILLHIFTISGAVSGCAAAGSTGTSRWHAAHMVATVLTAIFQGSVSVLIFTRTRDFLGQLKSYVREEDGAVILKLAGGLCVLIFCLEWVVLTLAFFLKYYAYVEGDNVGANSYAMRKSTKVGQEEDLKDWPWPFQV